MYTPTLLRWATRADAIRQKGCDNCFSASYDESWHAQTESIMSPSVNVPDTFLLCSSVPVSASVTIGNGTSSLPFFFGRPSRVCPAFLASARPDLDRQVPVRARSRFDRAAEHRP